MNKINMMRWLMLVTEASFLLSLCLVQAGYAGRKLALASSPAGRITLHLFCAVRDRRFSWHWQGIAREFRAS